MTSQSIVKFYEQPLPQEDAHAQLVEGLARPQKMISPKFFYDERGSELFSEITRTQEYYPTRTETALLEQYGSEIASCVGEGVTLLEYGSGSSEKIRILLEALRPARYVPMDISRDYLISAARQIAVEYPWLEVAAACVDYSQDFELPFELSGPVAGFFPGSSIGNFDPAGALRFLKRVNRQLNREGGLVIGVDLKKDKSILDLAYNDAAGITAEFNLNILRHINSQFGGNFSLELFRHVAFYNTELGCIQMFLESTEDQVFSVSGHSFRLKRGERIHTENSYKYSIDEFLALCHQAGFGRETVWTDEQNWFGVLYVS